MPYKSEKISLGKYDRRVKLSNTQREEIKELRKLGLSYADLYIQMTKDIGCEDVSVKIDTEIIGLGARINVKFKM